MKKAKKGRRRHAADRLICSACLQATGSFPLTIRLLVRNLVLDRSGFFSSATVVKDRVAGEVARW